jgi:uncharacterized protein Yka (UPF0111/DUF47 family)
MGVLKEVGDSLLKYGEIIVNKTEEYSKILKLKLDIKKIEGEIERIERKTGQHVIDNANNNNPIDINDPLIQEQLKRFREAKETIEQKTNEIEIIKNTHTINQ